MSDWLSRQTALVSAPRVWPATQAALYTVFRKRIFYKEMENKDS